MIACLLHFICFRPKQVVAVRALAKLVRARPPGEAEVQYDPITGTCRCAAHWVLATTRSHCIIRSRFGRSRALFRPNMRPECLVLAII